MSVYHSHQSGSDDNLNEQVDAISNSTNDHRQSELGDDNLNTQHDELRLRNQNNRELVLHQNRQRQQLALHMQIPLAQDGVPQRERAPGLKPPQLTRRALKRRNMNSLRQGGKLHQGNRVQKCTFKAGRRRC